MNNFGKWYNEYKTPIRIHDYFSLMIDQFPILVVRKYDDPHFEETKPSLWLGLFGFTIRLK